MEESPPPPKRANTGVLVDDSAESTRTLIQSTERLSIDDRRMDDAQPGPSSRTRIVNNVDSSSTSDKESKETAEKFNDDRRMEESQPGPSSRFLREWDGESSSSSDESIQSTETVESPGEIEVTCTTPVELAEVIWTIPEIQSLLQETVAEELYLNSDREIHAVSKLNFTTGQSLGQPIIWEARLTNMIVPKECPSQSDWETGWLTAYICPAEDNTNLPLQPAQARFDIRVDGEDPTCNEEMTYSSEIKTWEEFRRNRYHCDHDSVVAKLGRVDEILAPCNQFVGSEGQLRIKMNVFHIMSMPSYHNGDPHPTMTRKRRRDLGLLYNAPKKFL